MDTNTVFSLLITVLVLDSVTAMKSTTVIIPDASTTTEATTVLHQSMLKTLLHKPATFLHHTTTIILPDMKTTYIPDETTRILPDTTTTLPDATSRMLDITESLTQEPMTSTYNPQQETTIGTTPPGAGTCPQGFVQCTDGRCEPYDSLCGQFTPNPPPITTPIVASSTTVTSPTEWTLSSMNTDETTVTPPFISSTYSGPETCPRGFETCSDGKCEPFQFLCEEHQLGIPEISIVG